MTPTQFFDQFPTACKDGKELAIKFATMAEAWDACDNPQYLLWTLAALKVSYNRQKLGAAFTREIWHLLKDDRSKAVIEAIEQDRLTDEIRHAADAYAADAYAAYVVDTYAVDYSAVDAAFAAADAAAYSAVDAAYAAADAAAGAAYSAAVGAAYSAAAYVDSAAYSAAYSAVDAVAATYADAARTQMRQKQAQIIKATTPNPFKE